MRDTSFVQKPKAKKLLVAAVLSAMFLTFSLFCNIFLQKANGTAVADNGANSADNSALNSAVDAEYSGKTIKLTFNVPEEYRAGGTKSGSEIYVSYTILDWIEATPALSTGGKIAYDVYSPNAVAGVGGITGQFTGTGDNKWQQMHNTMEALEMKDTNGYSMAATADISGAIGNGWYKRETILPRKFAGPKYEPQRIGHIGIPLHIPAGTVINTDKIEVYYKDIKLVDASGKETKLTSAGTVPVAKKPLDLKENFKPSSDFTTANIGLTGEDGTAIPKIDETTIPRAGYVNEAIDFSTVNYLHKGNSEFTAAIKVDGVAQSGMTVIKSAGGNFNLEFIVSDSKNKNTTRFSKKVVVLENKNAINFLESDKNLVTDCLTGIPGDTVKIPFIYAYMEGDVKANLTVSDENDKNYNVVESDGFYEVKLADTDKTYVFEFTATKSGKTGNFSKSYTAEFPAEPFIDELSIPTDATSGDFIDLKNVKANDYQDGAIKPVITVKDPFGDTVNLVDGGFYAGVAGNYTLKIVATDKDGNKSELETELTSVKIVGQVIQWRINIPEAKRAQGVVKATRESIYGFIDAAPYKFARGDKLSYEVYSPSGVKGTGVIDGQHDGGKGQWYSMYQNGWYDQTDANEIKMGYEGDISAKAKDGWYKRESAVTDKMIQDGSVRHLALAFYSTDLITTPYIDVYYRNIKVLKADGTDYYFYNGLHQIKSTLFMGGGTNDVPGLTEMDTDMYSVMNPFYTVDVSKIKTEYKTSDENVLPTYVINYKSGLKINDVIITATDEANKKVTLVDGKLPDNMVGEIVINYSSKPGAPIAFSEDLRISVVDTSAPNVKTKDGVTVYKVKKGKAFAFPQLTLSDNYDAESRVKVSYDLVDPSGTITAIKKDETSVTLDSKGTYKLVITAKDSSNNKQTLELDLVVESGSLWIVFVVIGGVIVIGGAVALSIILTNKRRKKGEA